jgi:UTP--glucose-1-phosphate uridylyltransferase
MNASAELIDKMRAASTPEAAIEAFVRMYRKRLDGEPSTIAEADIIPVAAGSVPNLSELDSYTEAGRAALAKTAIIKLNGGLGTTMGLNGPKSLIRAKDGFTFLDITVRQVGHMNESLGITVPLLLMNSFFTDRATQQALAEMGPTERDFVDIFSQHKFPKVHTETLSPVSWPDAPLLEWNPAGHGDLFLSLRSSGLLQKLLDLGYRSLFVSNIDNLGAQIDLSILGYFVTEGVDFLMEVTDRTAMDRKGGHLARLKNGRLALREAGQCAPEDVASFRDVSRYSFFNTNNIWISLDAVQRCLDAKCNLSLPPVISRKNLDVRNPASPTVLHFESALGSAISLFDRSAALRVPRSRFAPVKNCDDLLVVWSDYYLLTPDYHLCVNPARRSRPISLSLDPAYYSRIDLLQSRFPEGAPSLVDCASLSVSGDIRFGRDVAVQGAVTLTNKQNDQAVVDDGAALSGDRQF